METTAINKPVYDALIEAGVKEENASAAARAVLPAIENVATTKDIDRLDAKISIIMWFFGPGLGFLVIERVLQILAAS